MIKTTIPGLFTLSSRNCIRTCSAGLARGQGHQNTELVILVIGGHSVQVIFPFSWKIVLDEEENSLTLERTLLFVLFLVGCPRQAVPSTVQTEILGTMHWFAMAAGLAGRRPSS